jgi:hypothetical protein
VISWEAVNLYRSIYLVNRKLLFPWSIRFPLQYAVSSTSKWKNLSTFNFWYLYFRCFTRSSHRPRKLSCALDGTPLICIVFNKNKYLYCIIVSLLWHLFVHFFTYWKAPIFWKFHCQFIFMFPVSLFLSQQNIFPSVRAYKRKTLQ